MSFLKVPLKRGTIHPRTGKVFFTYSDLQELPEFPESPLLELIDGELYMVPSPSTAHQSISVQLTLQIAKYLEKNPLGRLFHAPTDVVLTEKDVVVPDLFFISNERLHVITPKNIRGAPDFITEILSTNKERDIIVKKQLYEQHRVKEYWVVDPDNKTVVIFLLQENGRYDEGTPYQEDQVVPVKTIKGLFISLRDVFI